MWLTSQLSTWERGQLLTLSLFSATTSLIHNPVSVHVAHLVYCMLVYCMEHATIDNNQSGNVIHCHVDLNIQEMITT